MFEAGWRHWLYGAPSHWTRRWIGGWPIYVDDQPRPYGVRLRDVDGNPFVELGLGATDGMSGHGHLALVQALARQARAGA